MRNTLASLILLIVALSLPASAQMEPESEGEAPPQDPRTAEAGARFERALMRLSMPENASPEERKSRAEEAVVGLREVIRDYGDTSLFGIAKFNTGVVLCDHLERYDEAIAEFQELIDSAVDDKDPTGMLMNPFRNYRHHSWRMMSTCLERLGRPGKAVQAIFRARSAYIADCGTCQAGMEKSTHKRLVALVQAMAAGTTEADVDTVLAEGGRSERFLLRLGRKLKERGLDGDAGTLLGAVTKEFAGTEEAREAAADLGGGK